MCPMNHDAELGGSVHCTHPEPTLANYSVSTKAASTVSLAGAHRTSTRVLVSSPLGLCSHYWQTEVRLQLFKKTSRDGIGV